MIFNNLYFHLKTHKTLLIFFSLLNFTYVNSQGNAFDLILQKSDSLSKIAKLQEANKVLFKYLNPQTNQSKKLQIYFQVMENQLAENRLDSSKVYLDIIEKELKNTNESELYLPRLLHDKGKLLLQSNKSIDALKLFFESQVLAESKGQERYIMLNDLNIGRVLYTTGSADKAKYYLELAAVRARNLKNNSILVSAEGLIADYYMEKKDFKTAESYLKRIEQKQDNPIAEMAIYALYTKLYLFKEDNEQMLKYAAKAFELNSKLKITDGLSQAITNDIKSPNKSHEIEDIVENYKNHIKKANPYLYRENFTIPKTIQKEQDYKDEIDRLKVLIKLNDSIYKSEQDSIIKELEVKHQVEKRKRENLQLLQQNTQQKLDLEVENRQKWLFALGLISSLLILGIIVLFYHRNRKQKRLIEKLQQELHHRMKNNLAIIDSFVDIARDELKDVKGKGRLTELKHRIDSIHKVHELLYNSNKDVTSLSAQTYIDLLSNTVASSFSNQSVKIITDIKPKTTIRAEKTFPVGLIVNEFITNAFKYAFKDKTDGRIVISINEQKDMYSLELSDNGVGLPKDFDLENMDTFGMDIIKLLTKQLKGTFMIDSDDGLAMYITFPKN